MKNFKYAINGIWYSVKTEKNMKIHLALVIIVSAMGFYFNISATEWMVQLLLFALVIGTEMINTAIERITDVQYQELNENAGVIKDVAAGAVLFVSVVALIIGFIIYLPLILKIYTTV